MIKNYHYLFVSITLWLGRTSSAYLDCVLSQGNCLCASKQTDIQINFKFEPRPSSMRPYSCHRHSTSPWGVGENRLDVRGEPCRLSSHNNPRSLLTGVAGTPWTLFCRVAMTATVCRRDWEVTYFLKNRGKWEQWSRVWAVLASMCACVVSPFL